jgi:ribosomal protein L32
MSDGDDERTSDADDERTSDADDERTSDADDERTSDADDERTSDADDAMRDCPSCGLPTPPGRFCVRCGSALDDGGRAARGRTQFAAAPGQRRLAPWLVSTLFPHLPHGSMRDFRIALGGGVAVVAALAALRLFPIALIVAAALLPLITVLYFVDVDVYEGEPLWATAWTFGWGAAAGVGAGFIARAVAAHGPALIDRGSTAHVVTGGILLPALGVVLMLAGPLVLLRYRRFNEVLDGATFGSACAAAFAAAQAIVVGAGVLGGGVRPIGDTLPWIARLVTLGVATPVLSMSAIGAAVAAIWLRYRAPVGDRGALGVLGHPAVAIPTAAALVIAGAVGETFLPVGWWLATVVALDLAGLALLRRALHLGLVEEAAEAEIGPPITCANCGATTARHTFCGNCGIALKALPKDRAGSLGEAGGRLHASGERAHRRWLVAFAAGALAIAALGVLVAVVAAPATRQPVCTPGVPCGAPPALPKAVRRATLSTFPGYTVWTSPGLGFSLRYSSQIWSVAQQGAAGVQLETPGGSGVLVIIGAPQSQASPRALLNAEASNLSGQMLGFTTDSATADQLLGPGVGLRPGVGAVFGAAISDPQAPQTPVTVAAQSAGDGNVSIAAVVITAANDPQTQAAVYSQADDIIDSIEWAGSS